MRPPPLSAGSASRAPDRGRAASPPGGHGTAGYRSVHGLEPTRQSRRRDYIDRPSKTPPRVEQSPTCGNAAVQCAIDCASCDSAHGGLAIGTQVQAYRRWHDRSGCHSSSVGARCLHPAHDRATAPAGRIRRSLHYRSTAVARRPDERETSSDGRRGLVETTRDLTARETECCSFFTFTVTPGPADQGEALTWDVEVPAQHADVLNALTTRASSGLAGRADLMYGTVGGLRTGEVAEQGRGEHPDSALLRTSGPDRRTDALHRRASALPRRDGGAARRHQVRAATRVHVGRGRRIARHRTPGTPDPGPARRAIEKIGEVDRRSPTSRDPRRVVPGHQCPLRQPHQLHLRRLPHPFLTIAAHPAGQLA